MQKKTRQEITAAEHQKLLDADPQYQERLRAMEEQRALGRAQSDVEESTILKELAANGILTQNLTALWSLKQRSPLISSILVPHLDNTSLRTRTTDNILRAIVAAGPCDGLDDALRKLLEAKKKDLPETWLVVGTTVDALLQFATLDDVAKLAALLADAELKDYHKQIRARIKKLVSKKMVGAVKKIPIEPVGFFAKLKQGLLKKWP